MPPEQRRPARATAVRHDAGTATAKDPHSDPRLERWERLMDIPLTVGAFAFLVVYAIPIIWPHVSDPVARACGIAGQVIWIGFLVEYLYRLVIAKHKWQFFRSRWFDFITVALPLFRPLRLLRLVFLVRILNRRAGSSFRGKIVTYVVASALLLVLVGALAIVDAERELPGAYITDFWDGLWWAFVTITTVGYGDLVPVSVTGRIVATVLMLFGIAVLGTVTATLASWIVERVDDANEEAAQADAALDAAAHAELLAEVRALRSEIADLRAAVGGNGKAGGVGEQEAPAN